MERKRKGLYILNREFVDQEDKDVRTGQGEETEEEIYG